MPCHLLCETCKRCQLAMCVVVRWQIDGFFVCVSLEGGACTRIVSRWSHFFEFLRLLRWDDYSCRWADNDGDKHSTHSLCKHSKQQKPGHASKRKPFSKAFSIAANTFRIDGPVSSVLFSIFINCLFAFNSISINIIPMSSVIWTVFDGFVDVTWLTRAIWRLKFSWYDTTGPNGLFGELVLWGI